MESLIITFELFNQRSTRIEIHKYLESVESVIIYTYSVFQYDVTRCHGLQFDLLPQLDLNYLSCSIHHVRISAVLKSIPWVTMIHITRGTIWTCSLPPKHGRPSAFSTPTFKSIKCFFKRTSIMVMKTEQLYWRLAMDWSQAFLMVYIIHFKYEWRFQATMMICYHNMPLKI
jgi:hypothetical protein